MICELRKEVTDDSISMFTWFDVKKDIVPFSVNFLSLFRVCVFFFNLILVNKRRRKQP